MPNRFMDDMGVGEADCEEASVEYYMAVFDKVIGWIDRETHANQRRSKPRKALDR